MSPTDISPPARNKKKNTCKRVRWARALNASTWPSFASRRANGSGAVDFTIPSISKYRTPSSPRRETPRERVAPASHRASEGGQVPGAAHPGPRTLATAGLAARIFPPFVWRGGSGTARGGSVPAPGGTIHPHVREHPPVAEAALFGGVVGAGAEPDDAHRPGQPVPVPSPPEFERGLGGGDHGGGGRESAKDGGDAGRRGNREGR